MYNGYKVALLVHILYLVVVDCHVDRQPVEDVYTFPEIMISAVKFVCTCAGQGYPYHSGIHV